MRRFIWGALALVLAAIAVITLWPTPVDAPAKTTISDVLTALHEAGVPTAVNYTFVEAASNVLMFLPLGIVLALLLPRKIWWTAPLIACGTSALIELTQFVFLPQRFATIFDVAANTGGALLGALIVLASGRLPRGTKEAPPG